MATVVISAVARTVVTAQMHRVAIALQHQQDVIALRVHHATKAAEAMQLVLVVIVILAMQVAALRAVHVALLKLN